MKRKVMETELLQCMQNISQKHFKCDWENGLEYILWHWMKEGLSLSSQDHFALHIRHTKAEGWFVEEEGGHRFVAVNEWQTMYAEEFGDISDFY